MQQEDVEYFERRAEQELRLAQLAVHPRVVRAHYFLAGIYLDKVYGGPAETAAEPAGLRLVHDVGAPVAVRER